MMAMLIAGILPLLFISGCSTPAPRSSGPSPEELGPVISEARGEIINVRDVMITPTASTGAAARGTSSRMGTAAVMGAITGSPVPLVRGVSSVMIDAGRGRLDNRMGEEITVRLKNGNTVMVVQERSDPPMSLGEEVIVVTHGIAGRSEKIRVTREPDDPSAPIGARRL
jgi:outer membrane lipoprotein SlyB